MMMETFEVNTFSIRLQISWQGRLHRELTCSITSFVLCTIRSIGNMRTVVFLAINFNVLLTAVERFQEVDRTCKSIKIGRVTSISISTYTFLRHRQTNKWKYRQFGGTQNAFSQATRKAQTSNIKSHLRPNFHALRRSNARFL